MKNLIKNILITTISFAVVSCAGTTPSVPVLSLPVPEVAKLEVKPIKSYFQLESDLSYFPEIIKIANCIMNDDDFKNEIKQIKKFTSSNEIGEQVVPNLESTQIISKVKTYRHWRKSSVIAYTDMPKDIIYFNTRNNPRSIEKMVNTLIHENLHSIGYGHTPKWDKYRPFSVPYLIGDISEKYVGKCK